MSNNVTKIFWTIQTGFQSWSGTNSRVVLEIYRDQHLLQRANLEPGNTPRLDQGSNATYYWQFLSPDHLGVIVSGTNVPYYEYFPQGIRGHLKVKLVAKGNDAWEKLYIDSTVVSGDLVGVPGTIDSVHWQENFDRFFFGRDVVLSTDSSEGFSSLMLDY